MIGNGGDRDVSREALRNAGIAFVIMLAIYLALLLIPGSPLRAEDGSILMSPLLLNVGIVIAIMFAVVGWVYGRAAGTMTTAREIPEAMKPRRIAIETAAYTPTVAQRQAA